MIIADDEDGYATFASFRCPTCTRAIHDPVFVLDSTIVRRDDQGLSTEGEAQLQCGWCTTTYGLRLRNANGQDQRNRRDCDRAGLYPGADTRAGRTVRARMMEIVADHLLGTGAELFFAEDAYLPMAPRAENRELLAELNAVNRDLGLPEMEESDPSVGGASDVGFVAARVPALAGRGAAGWGMHSDGETVDLDSLVRQAQRAAILIGRLGGARSRSSAAVSGSVR